MNNIMCTSEDPLVIIECEARKVAERFGATWSQSATEILAANLIQRLGGCQFYVPRQRSEDKKLRDGKIKEKFNGSNIKKLAMEYGISERTIRRILKN